MAVNLKGVPYLSISFFFLFSRWSSTGTLHSTSKTTEKNEQSVSKLGPVIAKAVCEIWTQLWPNYLSHLLQSYPHVLTKVQRVLERAKCVTASQIIGSKKAIMAVKEDSKKLFSLLSCR